MNVLLCLPFSREYLRSHMINYWTVLPIGVAYVASSLKEAGFNVYTLNLMDKERTLHEIMLQMIEKHDIQAVCCGGLAVQWPHVKTVLDTAKQIDSEIITVIGGALVEFSPIEAMAIIPSADCGVIGEAEITICELLRAFAEKNDIAKVDGIIYRTGNGSLAITDKRAVFPDIDTLPFPDYDGFFAEIIENNSCASVVTSRSCPFKCTFCSCSGGKAFRMRSMDSIFAEIDYLVTKYNIKRLVLSDEVFSLNPDRLIEFSKRVGIYNLSWCIYLRLSIFLTSDVLKVMKDSGCEGIFYGLESADNRILKSMNKGTDVSLMERVITSTKEAGISVLGQFIFGDPEETDESVNNTLQFMYGNRNVADQLFADMIRCYPGSALYDGAVKKGIINPVSHLLDFCPPVNISKLSDENYSVLLDDIVPIENQVPTYKFYLGKRFNTSFSSTGDGYLAILSCPKCQNEYSSILEAGELYTPLLGEFLCTSCNSNIRYSPIPFYVSWIEGKIRKLLESCNCAIWPISRHFAAVYGVSTALSDPKNNYVLINKNERLKNKMLLGKYVQTPDILSCEQNTIDTVIVFSSAFKEIEFELREKYPHIRPILFHEIGLIESL